MNKNREELGNVITTYPEIKGIHPNADFFPMYSDKELVRLSSAIKESGLINPLVVQEGTGLLLDGRNRLLACFHANVEPRFNHIVVEDGVDVLELLISADNKRIMTTSQKALVALDMMPIYKEAAMARMMSGVKHEPWDINVPGYTDDESGRVNKILSDKLKVSIGVIKQVNRISKEFPDQLELIRQGKTTVGKVYKNYFEVPKVKPEPGEVKPESTNEKVGYDMNDLAIIEKSNYRDKAAKCFDMLEKHKVPKTVGKLLKQMMDDLITEQKRVVLVIAERLQDPVERAKLYDVVDNLNHQERLAKRKRRKPFFKSEFKKLLGEFHPDRPLTIEQQNRIFATLREKEYMLAEDYDE